MLTDLFDIQDVAKISNVKKAHYTDKVINETNCNYKSPSRFRSRQVKPVNEDEDKKETKMSAID